MGSSGGGRPVSAIHRGETKVPAVIWTRGFAGFQRRRGCPFAAGAGGCYGVNPEYGQI